MNITERYKQQRRKANRYSNYSAEDETDNYILSKNSDIIFLNQHELERLKDKTADDIVAEVTKQIALAFK
jgi:hypothetical protein